MAAALQIFQWNITQGKEAEFWALTNEAIPLLEASGATVRLFQNAIAGPASGTAAFVAEYENMSAFGAASDAAAEDPAIAAFVAKLNASGAATLASRSISIEVARS